MTTKRGKRDKPPHLPTKAEVLKFVEASEHAAGKREIARAFGIRGAARADLRELLKEMAAEGLLARGRRGRVSHPSALPKVTVVEITGTDVDGELLACPTSWRQDDKPPIIIMAPGPSGRGRGPALGVGDRVLARLTKTAETEYEARTIRRIEVSDDRVLGVYTEVQGMGRVQPADKRARHDYVVERADSMGARSGELVIAEVKRADRRTQRLGLRKAEVRQRLGNMKEPRSISLIAIHSHGIPTDFPAEAVAEAEQAGPAVLGNRVDLRTLPLVTIDPRDARDFDDAVWAAPDDDPNNEGGWRVVVAIADVAHYVRPHGALDKAARERGNSVYFPDRVVPMLPEALSNDLCSLRGGVDRPCLAIRMWFDREGEKLRHQVIRGLMRSAATLHYGQVQDARDGNPDDDTGPLLEEVIAPLYGAYEALSTARARRGPLELDLPERRIVLGDDGKVAGITLRERLDAHRLVEEFMIQANVCAAESLGAKRAPCMYRVHEPPAPEKIESLRDYLSTLGYRLARGQVIKSGIFNGILAKAAGTPHARVINDVVLRSQSQAFYTPQNLGHFGLALRHYVHFTSPIRRYADLLVHRALITMIGQNPDGITDREVEQLEETGEHISHTERRAALAERDSNDRYLAAFMEDRIGAVFSGRISGVSRFGLFVALDDTGADGLVPMRMLSGDYYRHDERRHALVGERHRREYKMGAAVKVRLAEAAPVTGGLRFDLLTEPVEGRKGGKGSSRKTNARKSKAKPKARSKARRKR
ncbi:MAG: ribonuclease R [Sphingomonadales bacterium]